MMPTKTMFVPSDKLNNAMKECLLAQMTEVENVYKDTIGDRISIIREKDMTPFSWESVDPLTTAVHDAICTLWESYSNHRDRKITTAQIWRLLAGAETGAEPSKKVLQAIHDLVGKLMTTHVRIEIMRRDGKESLVFRGAMIGCSTTTHYKQGCIEKDVLNMGNQPPFLEYAKHRRRIVTYPSSLLALGGNSTKKTITLKHFLLTEIEIIRNEKNNRNNVIKIDRVYEEVGINLDAEDRQKVKSQKQDIREHVKSFLEDLQKEGHISSFSFRYSGNEAEAILIEIDTEKA